MKFVFGVILFTSAFFFNSIELSSSVDPPPGPPSGPPGGLGPFGPNNPPPFRPDNPLPPITPNNPPPPFGPSGPRPQPFGPRDPEHPFGPRGPGPHPFGPRGPAPYGSRPHQHHHHRPGPSNDVENAMLRRMDPEDRHMARVIQRTHQYGNYSNPHGYHNSSRQN